MNPQPDTTLAVLAGWAADPNADPQDRLTAIGRLLLDVIEPDPYRPDVADTPARFAKAMLATTRPDPADDKLTTFPLDTAEAGDEVLVTGVQAWTWCEHHMLPFSVNATIAYRPAGKVLGLSKLARVVRHYAAGLQVQERLTSQVHDRITAVTGSPDVAVLVTGTHLCMMMRGVRAQQAMTTTSRTSGVYTTAEWLASVQATHRDANR